MYKFYQNNYITKFMKFKTILSEEDKLLEIVQLVGKDALGED